MTTTIHHPHLRNGDSLSRIRTRPYLIHQNQTAATAAAAAFAAVTIAAAAAAALGGRVMIGHPHRGGGDVCCVFSSLFQHRLAHEKVAAEG
jgi:hypothetical protein